jgi:hypothetical protein
MPAEKYQVGHGADTADVATLLWILLGEPDDYDSNTAIRTLVELGIGDRPQCGRPEHDRLGCGDDDDRPPGWRRP